MTRADQESTLHEILALASVSRETEAEALRQALITYAALLEKWQKSLNLVGPSTLPDLWTRHILDSAQIFPLLPPQTHTLLDLGSGAGLPGLILALMGVPDVHLVESDLRKGAFLREAARHCGAKITLHTCRIESLAPFPADVITARALAPLPKLLGLCHPFTTPETLCFFPKGGQAESELHEARQEWSFEATAFPSRTDPQAQILQLSRLSSNPPQ